MFEYAPAAQSVQLPTPFPEVNLPAAQLIHDTDAFWEYFPGAQVGQLTDIPSVAE